MTAMSSIGTRPKDPDDDRSQDGQRDPRLPGLRGLAGHLLPQPDHLMVGQGIGRAGRHEAQLAGRGGVFLRRLVVCAAIT